MMSSSVKFFTGFIVVLGVLAVILVGASRGIKNPDNYLENLNTATLHMHDQAIQLFVADSEISRVRGLSHVAALSPVTGMIFVFSEPTVPSFWMKDMQFALDMVWIDDTSTVIDIHENIAPETYPQTFSPKQSVQYMVEIPAGMASEFGIDIGDQVVLSL